MELAGGRQRVRRVDHCPCSLPRPSVRLHPPFLLSGRLNQQNRRVYPNTAINNTRKSHTMSAQQGIQHAPTAPSAVPTGSLIVLNYGTVYNVSPHYKNLQVSVIRYIKLDIPYLICFKQVMADQPFLIFLIHLFYLLMGNPVLLLII